MPLGAEGPLRRAPVTDGRGSLNKLGAAAAAAIVLGALTFSGLLGRAIFQDSDRLTGKPAMLPPGAGADLELWLYAGIQEFEDGGLGDAAFADTLRPFPAPDVMEDMNRRHRRFWRANRARRLLREAEVLVHNYVTRREWMEDCVALLLRHGFNLTQAAVECDRVYEAYGELAAEDALYMDRYYWPHVGGDATAPEHEVAARPAPDGPATAVDRLFGAFLEERGLGWSHGGVDAGGHRVRASPLRRGTTPRRNTRLRRLPRQHPDLSAHPEAARS